MSQELLDSLEATWAPPIPEDRFYGYHPLPLLDFYRGLDVIGPGNGRSFLDVGSGIGSKMFLAAQRDFHPSGIERHAPYVDVSRHLHPTLPVSVIDAFSFTGYGEFDVVYCYRPCINPGEQDQLNRHIASHLRPGTLFFSAGGPYPNWLTPVGFQVWEA